MTSDRWPRTRRQALVDDDHRVGRSAAGHHFDALLIRLERACRHGLRLIFRFDDWHTSPLLERPYARDVIDHLNARPAARRVRVAEIGCGLGDIIRRVRYDFRTGLDADTRVLDAARLLARFGRRPAPCFERFVFPDGMLTGRFDAIILVNWIHHIPPDILGGKIKEYAREHLSPGGIIVIDTVSDSEYRYNHVVEDLTSGLACLVTVIGTYMRGRTIYAIAPTTA
jgi:SAM-dependent methyltransferase